MLIQSNWFDVLKKERIQVLSFDQLKILKNQINFSLLSFIRYFEDSRVSYKRNRELKKINDKKNILIFILLLFLGLFSIFFCSKLKKANEYEDRIVKQNQYIKTMEFNAGQLKKELEVLKSDIPQLETILLEYSSLHIAHINAIKNGDLNLNSEILEKIRKIPEKYSLSKMIQDIDDKIKIINHESKGVVKKNKFNQNKLLDLSKELKSQKQKLEEIEYGFHFQTGLGINENESITNKKDSHESYQIKNDSFLKEKIFALNLDTIQFKDKFDFCLDYANDKGEELLNVVYFTASWCMPCRWMEETTFPSIKNKYGNKIKIIPIDIDSFYGFTLLRIHRIKVLPTIYILDENKDDLEVIYGSIPPSELGEIIENHIKKNASNK